jgi:hypothetical protein
MTQKDKAESALKSKKKSLSVAEWMNQKPNPLPLFLKGQSVQVYRGAGWSAASVVDSTPNGCVVKLKQGQQDVRIYDARCIRPV